ncbi:MAG: hypothetical protein QOH21_1675 [Acidobacteriota bacterium]|nr:hypothetical protein [Acidobacteriota bacterium]
MGLDVYVGSLVRYYSGHWETILQRSAGEHGMRVEVIRSGEAKRGWLTRLRDRFAPRSSASVARAVGRWQQQLARQLGTPVSWPEDPDILYFTDRPGWDGYGALLLWAAYEEVADATRPKTAEGWTDDPVYCAATEAAGSRYRHLMAGAELWIPVEVPEPLDTVNRWESRLQSGPASDCCRSWTS